jgi:hypothetical protein
MGQRLTLNGITKNVYSDEWYTSQETVNLAIGLLDPKPQSVILCPFDSDQSLFVKTLKEHGHTVLHGMTNFLEVDYHCDYIITNPPFSIKDKVIERVFAYGVKTVLILPIDAMGGVKRHAMYSGNEYPKTYMPSRRIAYFDESGEVKKGSSFHSIIMTFNHGEQSSIQWGK